LKKKLVFWPIRGVNQNKNILQGGKPKTAYITGGKDLAINPMANTTSIC